MRNYTTIIHTCQYFKKNPQSVVAQSFPGVFLKNHFVNTEHPGGGRSLPPGFRSLVLKMVFVSQLIGSTPPADNLLYYKLQSRGGLADASFDGIRSSAISSLNLPASLCSGAGTDRPTALICAVAKRKRPAVLGWQTAFYSIIAVKGNGSNRTPINNKLAFVPSGCGQLKLCPAATLFFTAWSFRVASDDADS